MDSAQDTPCGVGCPIRRSRDQRLLASPPGFSQRATSFIASQCQGIHQMPFISRLSTTPNGKDQTALLQHCPTEDAANLSLEDTCRTRPSFPPPRLIGLQTDLPDVPASVTSQTRYSPIQSTIRSEDVITPSLKRTSCRVITRAGQIRCPRPQIGGGERDRTDDLLLAKQALSQLSYTPVFRYQRSGIRNQHPPCLIPVS